MRGDFGGVIMEGRKILAIFLKVIFCHFYLLGETGVANFFRQVVRGRGKNLIASGVG